MNRIGVMVPPPMEAEIDEYQERHGFENRSQTVRALLRQGLQTPARVEAE
jgi:metal-responsive CopG/Arc/MetJ family transcriptional regulator